MTDWERVSKLRAKGLAWSAIAKDRRVGFTADKGWDPGRALKVLYERRRSSNRGGPRQSGTGGTIPMGRRPRLSRRMTSLITAGVFVAFLGSVLWFLVLSPNAPPPAGSTHAYLDSYCGGLPEDVHYHVLLVIKVNGVQQPLPSYNGAGGIGLINQAGYTNSQFYCVPQGEHALHTHDGSGIIHIEMNDQFTVTPNLADLFAIWGEPLGPGQVWTFSGSVTATMWDMDSHAATSYSGDPGSIPLYRPPGGSTSNPYPIPQGWIFNGQYGNGASGGTFDGEIIWLNVTSGASSALSADFCHEGIPRAAPSWATCGRDVVNPSPGRPEEAKGLTARPASALSPHIHATPASTDLAWPQMVARASRQQD